MMERKFTDDEKILSLLKMSDDVYANAKLTPEEAKTLLDLINRQKAENSNLTSDLAYLQNDLTSVKAEIERLREEREKLLKECKKCGSKTQKVITKLQKQMRQNKSEAIKEFAERLKAKAMLHHGGVTVAYGSDIDNIVKEMTGENSNE